MGDLLEGASPQDFDLFRSRVFSILHAHLRDGAESGALDDLVKWAQRLVQLAASRERGGERQVESRAYFSPGEECRRVIRSLIGSARRRIDLCVFTITDNEITDDLIDALGHGRKLRILTDDLKAEDRGSDVDRLIKAGAEVRVDESDKHMHHKFALFDDRKLLTGSYNWTRSAAEKNEENVVVSDDPELLRAFRSEFDSLWAQFR